jgi:hypothetical protein
MLTSINNTSLNTNVVNNGNLTSNHNTTSTTSIVTSEISDVKNPPVAEIKALPVEPLKSSESIIRYLQALGKMLWMEEAQMTLDVAQYDMQFVNILPLDRYKGKSQSMLLLNTPLSNMVSVNSNQYTNSDQEKIFTCKIIVKGSNESRPRIAVGDKVRLRPMKDGLQYLNDICPRPIPMFELEGIILNFTLASETILCEFVAPPKEFFWGPHAEPIEYTDIWTMMSYHARFTFERSGLVFCHLALAELLNTSIVRKALFPLILETTSNMNSSADLLPSSPKNNQSSQHHNTLTKPVTLSGLIDFNAYDNDPSSFFDEKKLLAIKMKATTVVSSITTTVGGDESKTKFNP